MEYIGRRWVLSRRAAKKAGVFVNSTMLNNAPLKARLAQDLQTSGKGSHDFIYSWPAGNWQRTKTPFFLPLTFKLFCQFL